MKFCRNCGSSLAQTTPGAPAHAAPMAGVAMGAPMMPPMAPPAAAMPPPVAAMPPPVAAPAPARAPMGSTVTCPRCGTQTPLGFAFCQQCGLNMQAAAEQRPRTPSAQQPPVDPLIATLAADNVRAGSIDSALPSGVLRAPAQPGLAIPPPPSGAAAPVVRASAPQLGAVWGTAVLVNRDGSDGQRFALTAEDTVLGRAGSDIAFDDDRFLAKQHARIQRTGDGAIKLHPIDTLNGVFRKATEPVELADGAVVLVGREVLRFERVAPEERTVQPLVRHGVALFGSPPREPWGRLFQLIPSGGYRDVRHLASDEIVLGREEGDVVFRDDAFMSRRHAAITWDGRAAKITDLGSSNGTFVRVTQPVALKHGDHVRLGDQLLRIELGR